MPLTRDDEYANWTFQADIANNACTSGNHTYDIVAGAGRDYEVLWASLFNGDTTNRTGSVRVFTEAAATNLGISWFPPATINAAERLQLPLLGEVGAATINQPQIRRPVFRGLTLLRFQVVAIAVSQDTAMSMGARIRGSRTPTVTMTSPAGATETVNVNRVE